MRSALAGTTALARLFLRLDRGRLMTWVLVLGIVPVGTASAFQGLYQTEAERVQFAGTVTSNPAFEALLGPLYDASIGGLTAWRVGTLGSFLLGLMMVLTMLRHTRDDEETGRRELLGSTIVGRHAPLTAALLVSIGSGLLIGMIVSAGLAGLGLPVSGAVAFGAGFVGVAISFAAIGALAAQLTQAGSTGRGLAVAIAGLFFVVRMAGDAGGEGVSWLSWLSPIGWFPRLRPFAGEEWWVLALWILFAAALIAVALWLAARRDVGEGAIPPRPGPRRASPSLSNPSGLAWRLQRASLFGWTAGIGVLGVIYGSAADSIEELLEENPQLRQIFEQMGGSQTLTDAFFAAAVGIIALVATAYAIRSVLKLKSEEDSLRAEPVLATATPRARYAWSHVVYGLAGPVVILAVAGALAGATYGAVIGDVSGQVPRVLAAAMAQLPAVWVLTGIAMALYGTTPQLSSLSWGALVICLILGQLGQILRFPQWSLNLSPFSHIPAIPAEDLVMTPLLALVGLAAVLLLAGFFGFRRRDIPAT